MDEDDVIPFKETVLKLLRELGTIPSEELEELEKALDTTTTKELEQRAKDMALKMELKVYDSEVAREFLGGKTDIKGNVTITKQETHQVSGGDSVSESKSIVKTYQEYREILRDCFNEINNLEKCNSAELDTIKKSYQEEEDPESLKSMAIGVLKWMKENAVSLTPVGIKLMAVLQEFV